MDNYPLGLQPGDIILGYEGVPYKILLNELLDAQLPALLPFTGAKSAERAYLYQNAGMNWHLFETIDILQYASGNALHLSVAPMINLDVEPMLNNEQMEIPGIPFPDLFNDQLVSYGIMNNTNIGYIYLFSEWSQANPHPDQQFYEAVNVLKNTEGLIIDMRWNEGGWAFFDEAFKILFNEAPFTLNGANRCDPGVSLDLCPNDYANLHQIKGDPRSLYDHPIAVLLGPTCVSMGDRTANRLGYHPMVKFFGKLPAASFGLNRYIESFPGWFLRYSIEDMYHLNQPEIYLNRSEFPIDVPVWFNPGDVANGQDTIVKSALEWINNLAFAHDVAVNKTYVRLSADTVIVTAKEKNPNQHELYLLTVIRNQDSTITDNLNLFDDGMHGGGAANDDIWGNYYLPTSEQSFKVSVTTDDIVDETSRTLPNVAWFTTIGPISLDSMEITSSDTMANPGDRIRIRLILKNDGLSVTALNIITPRELISVDPCVTIKASSDVGYGDIAAGESSTANRTYTLTFNDTCQVDKDYLFVVDILSEEYNFWSDTFSVHVYPTGIEDKIETIPTKFALQQNYPNPFNPNTVISWQLPVGSQIDLSIYNILGEKVATLVSKHQRAGYHKVEFNAENLPSGIYFYRITAGEFYDVRKMILLR